MPTGPSQPVPAFFMPTCDGASDERAYERLRRETEVQMGRPPSRRRIAELWTRRGNRDCVTTVGSPDPISGGIVIAIFDMGPHQPFVSYRQDPDGLGHQSCDVLGCSAYSVSEFAG